jgi:L-fuculose-phosphate aldolase
MLHQLGPGDALAVGLAPDAQRDLGASMELLNHRALYAANTAVGAVIHAHAPCAVAQAHGRDRIVPYDEEGRYYFDAIPVIRVENAIASPEVAAALRPLAAHGHAAVVARHGIFAWGSDIEEALKFATVVESCCRILQLLEGRHEH